MSKDVCLLYVNMPIIWKYCNYYMYCIDEVGIILNFCTCMDSMGVLCVNSIVVSIGCVAVRLLFPCIPSPVPRQTKILNCC